MNTAAKKHTLRMFTNGVYILTSRSDDSFGAATVTWVSQVSFNPPAHHGGRASDQCRLS